MANIHSISSDLNNVHQDIFPFHQWTITTRKSHILHSKCVCSQGLSRHSPVDLNTNTNSEQIEAKSNDEPREENKSKRCSLCLYYHQLPQLNSLPDMVFDKNVLRLHNNDKGVGIEFNVLDSLRLVKNNNDVLKVAISDGWLTARSDCLYIRNKAKQFDWTFTTNYCGTLYGPNESQDTESETPNRQFLVCDTDERIDMNKLKVKEDILFYDDVHLFEDELADNGVAQYNVKVRVMNRSLFILARFFLRVDNVLARINDTRIFYELDNDYLLREYTNREALLEDLNLPVSILINPVELSSKLPLVTSKYEKLYLPK